MKKFKGNVYLAIIRLEDSSEGQSMLFFGDEYAGDYARDIEKEFEKMISQKPDISYIEVFEVGKIVSNKEDVLCSVISSKKEVKEDETTEIE